MNGMRHGDSQCGQVFWEFWMRREKGKAVTEEKFGVKREFLFFRMEET